MTEAVTAPRTYSSEIMAERRSRILREARDLLAKGESNLTINRLCERAEVAARTVYRAFGDREGVIHAVIAEHMEAIQAFLAVAPLKGDIESVFREYDWITAELFRGPEFARVIVGFYFSQNPRPRALASLRSVAYQRIVAWMDHAARAGHLAPALDRERIALHQVDTEYVQFNKWAAGQTPNERVAEELKANFLMTAIIASQGLERDRLTDLLANAHARLGPPQLD
ncbi:TetR/AcrR family transcriptional regulator [Sphingomonas sp. 1P06PA]|uniref:TetR/AcrR family transcriptional regulator n=1 Tax=Sphingomonas sp. 1P06PA TaxID=554121 RepID=UPI0039A52032